MTNPSLYLDRAALHSNNSARTTDFGQHIEITLQTGLNREYTLRLFVENEEIGLHTQDNRTWTPAQRPYVPCFPVTCTL